jgi:hypothetical protein
VYNSRIVNKGQYNYGSKYESLPDKNTKALITQIYFSKYDLYANFCPLCEETLIFEV